MTPDEALPALRAALKCGPTATWDDIVAVAAELNADATDFGVRARTADEHRAIIRPLIQAAAEGRRGSLMRLADAIDKAGLTVAGGAQDAATLLALARCSATGMPRPKGMEYRPKQVGGEQWIDRGGR